jgi:hypothetical protein
VNHFWRLLHGLEIPYVTLLDLDLGRHQGGWGRVRYVATQLRKFAADGNPIKQSEIAALPKWNGSDQILTSDLGKKWLADLDGHGVFFATPLDLDFAMLENFGSAYGLEEGELAECDDQILAAVLGQQHHGEDQYSSDQQEKFGAYHKRSKLGSKPTAHLSAMANLDAATLKGNTPAPIARLLKAVGKKLDARRMITSAAWIPADGLVLEPNALRAAKEISKTLALTAGPGAGKTEMLAQWANFLLRTGLCQYPQRILAISFKVDASRNLRERVRRRCGSTLAARFDSHTFHAFAKRLIDRFRPALTGENALDADYVIGPQRVGHTSITFEDLVPLAVEILQTSDVALNAVRQTYSHVFLDEFQDCTNAQYSLIRTAFKGTPIQLTAVGDTKQRIMGWAGALEGIFLKFASDFGAVGLNLYQNFRSKPRLRRMQNRMVRILEPAAALSDDAIKGGDGEIEIAHFEDSLLEADALADSIQIWIKEEGIPASEIAILVSKQPELYAESLMAELQSRGIPYRNEQKLQDLSVEPIARLIVDFLSVVFGEREPDAYSRLMAVLTFANLDDDSRLQSKWQHFLDRKRGVHATVSTGDMKSIRLLIGDFLDELGRQFLTALSAEYEQGPYLDKKIEETIEQVAALRKQDESLVRSLPFLGRSGGSDLKNTQEQRLRIRLGDLDRRREGSVLWKNRRRTGSIFRGHLAGQTETCTNVRGSTAKTSRGHQTLG